MHISILDVAFAIFNFLILLLLLQMVLYRPVVRMLDEREARVRNENEEIERKKAEILAMKEELEKQNTALAAQSQQILEDAKKMGQKAREEILSQAREEARYILSRAEDEVVRERTRAWEELWGEMVNLVITAATKVVGEDLDDAKHRKRIQNFINSLDPRQIGELTNGQQQ